MQILIGCLAALMFIAAPGARADGKFYSDRIPPELPYQRAILVFDGKHELLAIESKFESREGERFGWVVPVPAVPEIRTMDGDLMDMLYGVLKGNTRPLVIGWDTVLAFASVIWFAALLIRITVSVYRRLRYGLPMRVGRQLFYPILILVFMALAFPSYQGIDMVKQVRVGPYEATVLRGNSAAEVSEWLNGNGFRFDDRDRAAFEGYQARGWLYVAARLDAGAKGAAGGKLVPPLILSFPTTEAVYPLALTGSAGRNTELQLYVFASSRMDAGNRLPLRFAGERRTPPPSLGDRSLQRIEKTWISEFRGVLTPEQMKSDLVLKPSTDRSSYREWEFRF